MRVKNNRTPAAFDQARFALIWRLAQSEAQRASSMANDTLAAATGIGPIVETVSGKLRGSLDNGIHIFKGVPYGASTAGHNRFRPPQPPPAWSDVREALAYRGRAWQLPGRPPRRPVLETLLGPADTTPETEDCLTLNLWTPGLGDGGTRPVMVWLHGGAFAYGSGNRTVTDGANLARRGDVVVVSVNHRLNIFGFLHLDDIGGAGWMHSGNAGMLDLIAALRWVHDNIAVFGGDPSNVTVFGESGGGGKVSALLAMPAAKGLFHRAIIQSGAAIRVLTRERANALAAQALRELGLGGHECERLLEQPPERILAAIAPAVRALGRSRWPLLDRYDFGPVVDGADLPQHPCDPEAPGIGDGIPMLVGGTREESAFFLADDDQVWNGVLSETELRQRVAAVAGAEADALLAVYNAAMPQASPGDRLIKAMTGSNFWIRTVILAERYAARPHLHVLTRLAEPGASGASQGTSCDGPTVRVRQHRNRGHDRRRHGRARTGGANGRHLDRICPTRPPRQSGDPGVACLHASRTRDDGVRRRMPLNPRSRPQRPCALDAPRQGLTGLQCAAASALRTA